MGDEYINFPPAPSVAQMLAHEKARLARESFWSWLRIVALVVLVLVATTVLSACATNDDPPPPKPTPAPDPRICAPLESPPPIQGGIVQPVTQEQVDAVTEFLRGEADLFSWGGRGWTRAGLAKDRYCGDAP